MKVSASQPFQVIYSLFQHEYLGFLFESFVVHVDDNGGLTLQHQNISSKNAPEFGEGLNEDDYELINLMDAMQQEVVIKHFNKKLVKPEEYFLKIYDPEKGNILIQKEIEAYLERRRAFILEKLVGKHVYEMGRDGEPTWRKIEAMPKKATVLFHFKRNSENTHYYPTIKYEGHKLDFQFRESIIVCNSPAWMLVEGRLFTFEKEVDGLKLQPFLNRRFIAVPRKIEDTYYRKFVAPVVASFDVYAQGLEIKTVRSEPIPLIKVTSLQQARQQVLTLFEGETEQVDAPEINKVTLELNFVYEPHVFRPNPDQLVSIVVENVESEYTFHRIVRDQKRENEVIQFLKDLELEIRNSKITLHSSKAFAWLNENRERLVEAGFRIKQKSADGKKYFVGKATIDIEIKENIDWFDINAIIKFGEYSIPFKDLRKYLVKKQYEFELPNGEIAVIPENWITEYSELFAFTHDTIDHERGLKKHHLALVKDLEISNLANVIMDRKLNQLRDFDRIEDYPMPAKFRGELRPYQKAGYNWLNFLNHYNFGGCLADDMGLGKTVQTLAMLQRQKEQGCTSASLLAMPTSLVYNWEMESKKFTPGLKVLAYTGTDRLKDVSRFDKYDLILTSYGIVRMDIDILASYKFHYVILDESQAIKNPGSNIAKAVKELDSRHRLILTGTPLENSTMDIWSQMAFINPGLLGQQSFFKTEFLNPIEKKSDELKTKKLNSIIKPFVLRRHKSQVATDLPPKVNNIQYCTMSTMQEERYEEVKAQYRNKILEHIESHGVGGSQMLLLQGLTTLRQIANHPKMVDQEYEGDSGKMRDLTHMLTSAISKGHKILVFSQFVKHLKIVKEMLGQRSIPFAYLDGSTKDRKTQVNNFQENDDLKVFLISLKAGGLGLNLTEADYVFLLDPWWNPAVEAQAVDRAHRIGQKKQVFNYKFITRNSVEEKILELQKRKLSLANSLITTESSFVKGLSKEDIEALLD